jgi:ABC-type antimicrobial peptide transport system permease subunit
MLMAIMERVREIGMLMAIGMSKVKVFFMIMLETVFLSIT